MARRRRALLATVAASGLSAVAGCAAVDRGGTDPATTGGPDETTGNPNETTSETRSAAGFDAGSVYEAVPAAAISRTDSRDFLSFTRQENAALAETLDWLGPAGRRRLERQLGRTPLRLALPPERVDELIESDAVTVVDGEFTAAEAFDAYDYYDEGIERLGTDGDYVLGRSPAAPAGTRDVAARDGRWLRVRGGVEPALAAERGAGDGLASLDPALRDHVAATSSGGLSIHQFYVEPVGPARASTEEGIFEGAVVGSFGFEIGPESVELVGRYLFADAAAADAAPVDEWLAGQSVFDPYDLNPSRDGRTVRMRGEIPTAEFDLLRPEDERRPTPQVNFEFGVEDGTLTITHTAGDAVAATALTVYVGDRTAESQFEDGDVAAGDSVSIDLSGVESGTTVRIVWSEDGDSAVLATFTLP